MRQCIREGSAAAAMSDSDFESDAGAHDDGSDFEPDAGADDVSEGLV